MKICVCILDLEVFAKTKDEESFNEILVRCFLKEFSSLTNRFDSHVGFINNCSVSMVKWFESKLVFNFDTFGIVDLGRLEEENNQLIRNGDILTFD